MQEKTAPQGNALPMLAQPVSGTRECAQPPVAASGCAQTYLAATWAKRTHPLPPATAPNFAQLPAALSLSSSWPGLPARPEPRRPQPSGPPCILTPKWCAEQFKGEFRSEAIGGPAAGKQIRELEGGFADGSLQAYVNGERVGHVSGAAGLHQIEYADG